MFLGSALAATVFTDGAHAQPSPTTRRRPPPAPSGWGAGGGGFGGGGLGPRVERNNDVEDQKPPEVRALRGRFGLDVAERLLRTSNASDRRRAIERAASLGTPESVGFLVEQAARISSGDGDGIVAIACARALAVFSDNERARAALYELTVMPSRLAGRDPGSLEDPFDDSARDRARGMAALALARTREARSLGLLSDTIRSNGAGASAAKSALYAYPPEKPAITTATIAPQALDFIVASGDLRALPAVLALTDAQEDHTRALAIRAMADLKDARVIPIATALTSYEKPEVRVAATYALARLAVPGAEKALLSLFETDVVEAIEMSEWVQSDAVTKVLATTAIAGPRQDLRLMATLALGHQGGDLAARSLLTLSQNSAVTYEAVHALARSPASIAGRALETLLAAPKDPSGAATRRLAARGYLVRAKVTGERSMSAEERLSELAKSSDAADRAVGIQARVALGAEDVTPYLASKDKDVRRAAMMAIEGLRDKPTRLLIAARLTHDEDAAVRELAGVALLSEDDAAPTVTSAWLSDRATSGAADAPLAVVAYVRRADEKDLSKVDAFLASTDPIMRIHAARGLARSTMPQSTGRLASTYAFDPDARVRKAALRALLARPEKTAPVYVQTVSEAAALDPDAEIRFIARAALLDKQHIAPDESEAVWVRVNSNTASPGDTYTATYLAPDGTATPLVFDREGHAVLLGVAPGKGLLRMTPVLP